MNQIYTCDKCKQQYQITQPGEYQCQCGEKFTVAPMPQCPFCKSDVSPDALKCPNCGEWIKQKPKSMLVYVLLCMFLPTGLTGCGEIYIGRKKTAVFVLILSVIFFVCVVRTINGVEDSFTLSVSSPTSILFFVVMLLSVFCSGIKSTRKINQHLTH